MEVQPKVPSFEERDIQKKKGDEILLDVISGPQTVYVIYVPEKYLRETETFRNRNKPYELMLTPLGKYPQPADLLANFLLSLKEIDTKLFESAVLRLVEWDYKQRRHFGRGGLNHRLMFMREEEMERLGNGREIYKHIVGIDPLEEYEKGMSKNEG